MSITLGPVQHPILLGRQGRATCLRPVSHPAEAHIKVRIEARSEARSEALTEALAEALTKALKTRGTRVEVEARLTWSN